jgi:hypothetical protein
LKAQLTGMHCTLKLDWFDTRENLAKFNLEAVMYLFEPRRGRLSNYQRVFAIAALIVAPTITQADTIVHPVRFWPEQREQV